MTNPESKIFISWIIPVYNDANHIQRCIESIIGQGLEYEEYEIIIVNDGSTDETTFIIKSYQRAYPNIHTIDIPHGGAGAARNVGIKNACGEFVHFIDSDDYLVPEAIRNIKNQMQCDDLKADLIMLKAQRVTEDLTLAKAPESIKLTFMGNIVNFANKFGIYPTCWRQIIRRDLIKDIRFKDYKIGEDLDFMLEIYRQSDLRAISFSGSVYCHTIHAESVTQSIDTIALQNIIHDYSHIYEKINDKTIWDAYTPECRDSLIANHIQGYLLTVIFKAKSSLTQTRTLLMQIGKIGILNTKISLCKSLKILKFLSNKPMLFWLFSQLYNSDLFNLISQKR